jgi:hypothetical protein
VRECDHARLLLEYGARRQGQEKLGVTLVPWAVWGMLSPCANPIPAPPVPLTMRNLRVKTRSSGLGSGVLVQDHPRLCGTGHTACIPPATGARTPRTGTVGFRSEAGATPSRTAYTGSNRLYQREVAGFWRRCIHIPVAAAQPDAAGRTAMQEEDHRQKWSGMCRGFADSIVTISSQVNHENNHTLHSYA